MKNSTHTTLPVRDGKLESAWQTGETTAANTFANDSKAAIHRCDCLVVGAGITGLSTALLLQQKGKKVIVAEAYLPGFGTTGGTSAHINTFADTTYKEAEDAFGREGARLFAAAVNEGADTIRRLIEELKISCDYEVKPGYLYAENEKQAKQLDELFESAKEVGIRVSPAENVPTPVSYVKALCFEGQAQFHPIKYLDGLLKAYLSGGGTLLTHSRVERADHHENGFEITAGSHLIHADILVYATHIPPKITLFNFRCAPYRSYVLGVLLADDTYPDALVYDMQEPYHYFRTHELNGRKLLIAGGNDHKTGHGDPEKAFASLEAYVKKYYSVKSIEYRWSSQYYVPVDGLPYIGQMPGAPEGTYCATGFNGNGMMLGTVAATILSRLAAGETHPYEKIVSPSRIKPVAGFSEFVKENADVVYHFVADRFSIHETDSVRRLKPGSGQVIEVDGKKIAAYKDPSGKIHALNPVCTHAGCIVSWNAEETSWDCPCHGARFDIDGKVLNGPADRDLGSVS